MLTQMGAREADASRPACPRKGSRTLRGHEMTTEEILARLVSFPSVVGKPNGAIVEWIRNYAEGFGARVTIAPGPEGDRANLFTTRRSSAGRATSRAPTGRERRGPSRERPSSSAISSTAWSS
jgi:hypothetical protein